MCLPVTNQLSEVMAGADQQAIVGLLSRMGEYRSVGYEYYSNMWWVIETRWKK